MAWLDDYLLSDHRLKLKMRAVSLNGTANHTAHVRGSGPSVAIDVPAETPIFFATADLVFHPPELSANNLYLLFPARYTATFNHVDVANGLEGIRRKVEHPSFEMIVIQRLFTGEYDVEIPPDRIFERSISIHTTNEIGIVGFHFKYLLTLSQSH